MVILIIAIVSVTIFYIAIFVLGISFLESGPIDCGTDLGCFLNAINNCQESSITHVYTLNLLGILQTTISHYEIIGMESDMCLIYLRTDQIDLEYSPETTQQLLETGSTQQELDQIVASINEEADKLEGLDAVCKYDSNDAVDMISRWDKGDMRVGDLSSDDCEGTMIGAASNLY